MNVTLQLAPGQARRVFAYWHALQADPYAPHPYGKLRSEQDGYDLMEQGPLVRRYDNVWRFVTPEHGVSTLSLESQILSYDGPRVGIGGPALPLRELFELGEDQTKALASIPVLSYTTREPRRAWWETSEEHVDEDPSPAQGREIAQAQVEALLLVWRFLRARQQMAFSKRAAEFGVQAEEMDGFISQMPSDEYAELMADAVMDFKSDLRRMVEILSAKAGSLTTRHDELDVVDLMREVLNDSMHAPRAKEVWLKAKIQNDIPPVFADRFGFSYVIDILIALAIQRAQACSDVIAQASYSGESHVFEVSYHPRGSAKADVEFFSASELFDSADSSGSINWETFDLVYARSQVSYRRGDFGATATPEGGVRVWFTWPSIVNQQFNSDQRACQP